MRLGEDLQLSKVQLMVLNHIISHGHHSTCVTGIEIQCDATTLLLWVAVFGLDIQLQVQLQEEGGCLHRYL